MRNGGTIGFGYSYPQEHEQGQERRDLLAAYFRDGIHRSLRSRHDRYGIGRRRCGVLHRSDFALLLHIQTGEPYSLFARSVHQPGRMRYRTSWPLCPRSFQHQSSRVFRILLPPRRVPHLQVDISASHLRRVNGVWRFGLADLFVSVARKLSVPIQFCSRDPRRGCADRLAPCDGRRLSTWKV